MAGCSWVKKEKPVPFRARPILLSCTSSIVAPLPPEIVMLLFVLVFLSLYTAMHLLVFWGIHPLLAGHPLLPALNWLWMGLMIFAPLLVRLLDRGGHELPARALAWIGYTWMGFIFLAFCLCTLLAGWELLAWALGRIWPAAANSRYTAV